MHKNRGFAFIIVVFAVLLFIALAAVLKKEAKLPAPAAQKLSIENKNLTEAKKPEIIELQNGDAFTLEAKPIQKTIDGKAYKMLSYNGSIPGPIIKVKQGSEIMLNFINNTDIENTIHSHGVRLENRYDGTPEHGKGSVAAGASFVYKIKFPDEGVYWYHPHVREDYAQELGLYGNFLVMPQEESAWPKVDREIPLIVDDLLIENGQIPAFDKKKTNFALMGRFGNTFLVNGETNYRLSVNQGEIVRFFITNAANARTFNLAIPNAKMKLIGGDGGRYQREQWVENIILAPSERAIIDVLFDKSQEYMVEHVTPSRVYRLGFINADSQTAKASSHKSEFLKVHTNKDLAQFINLNRPLINKEPDENIVLTVDISAKDAVSNTQNPENIHAMHGMNMSKIEWEDTMRDINEKLTSENVRWKLIDAKSSEANMDIHWSFQKGQKVKIRIQNSPDSAHPMQHPIHLHGQRFLILSTNGVLTNNFVWKDVVQIKTGDSVDLLVDMENPGQWMIHCHINEHLESGMAADFKVI